MISKFIWDSSDTDPFEVQRRDTLDGRIQINDPEGQIYRVIADGCEGPIMHDRAQTVRHRISNKTAKKCI